MPRVPSTRASPRARRPIPTARRCAVRRSTDPCEEPMFNPRRLAPSAMPAAACHPSRLRRCVVAGFALAALAGCAGTAVDDNFAAARQLARERLSVDSEWLTTDDARRRAKTEVDALLAKPL